MTVLGLGLDECVEMVMADFGWFQPECLFCEREM